VWRREAVIELEKARAHLETLELSEAASVLESRLELAAKNQSTYAGFLADLLGTLQDRRREPATSSPRASRDLRTGGGSGQSGVSKERARSPKA